MTTYHEISEKHLKEFKAICEEKDITYETEAEYREAANNLVGFFDILIQSDMEERGRKERLKSEPKGFALKGEGRNCSLCGRSVYEPWNQVVRFKNLHIVYCATILAAPNPRAHSIIIATAPGGMFA